MTSSEYEISGDNSLSHVNSEFTLSAIIHKILDEYHPQEHAHMFKIQKSLHDVHSRGFTTSHFFHQIYAIFHKVTRLQLKYMDFEKKILFPELIERDIENPIQLATLDLVWLSKTLKEREASFWEIVTLLDGFNEVTGGFKVDSSTPSSLVDLYQELQLFENQIRKHAHVELIYLKPQIEHLLLNS